MASYFLKISGGGLAAAMKPARRRRYEMRVRGFEKKRLLIRRE